MRRRRAMIALSLWCLLVCNSCAGQARSKACYLFCILMPCIFVKTLIALQRGAIGVFFCADSPPHSHGTSVSLLTICFRAWRDRLCFGAGSPPHSHTTCKLHCLFSLEITKLRIAFITCRCLKWLSNKLNDNDDCEWPK